MSEDDADGDEDWFEAALRDEEDADVSDGGASANSNPADDAGGGEGPFGNPDDASDVVGASDGAFGGSTGESAFGEDAEGTGVGDGMFDDDFASAFGGTGGEEGFDDEGFETEIPRVDLGIEGLDRMIQGGVPQRHLLVAIGSAGTGKTTFGLQFLNHGLGRGQNCVFITLEQTREAILDTANEWGWDFARYEEEDRLAVVDLDPIEMANSLDNIRGELPELVEAFDADRLVLDSVSLLEMMYDRPAQRRTEVYDFTRSLKRAGVTTFLTSEASETSPYASRHGIIEYLTDAVFVLKYVRTESRETRLAIEIQKIRNANHSRETKPYELTDEGISVYEQANIF